MQLERGKESEWLLNFIHIMERKLMNLQRKQSKLTPPMVNFRFRNRLKRSALSYLVHASKELNGPNISAGQLYSIGNVIVKAPINPEYE